MIAEQQDIDDVAPEIPILTTTEKRTAGQFKISPCKTGAQVGQDSVLAQSVEPYAHEFATATDNELNIFVPKEVVNYFDVSSELDREQLGYAPFRKGSLTTDKKSLGGHSQNAYSGATPHAMDPLRLASLKAVQGFSAKQHYMPK